MMKKLLFLFLTTFYINYLFSVQLNGSGNLKKIINESIELNGDFTLEEINSDMLKTNGNAKIIDSTIKYIITNGIFTGSKINNNFMQSNGTVILDNSHLENISHIGSLSLNSCTCQSIDLTTEESSINHSHIRGNIIIKKNAHWLFGVLNKKSEINMSDYTVIEGDIIFEDENKKNNIIHLDNTVKIKGKIINQFDPNYYYNYLSEKTDRKTNIISMGNNFSINYIEQAPIDGVNPHFPIITIKSGKKISGWLQIVYTDTKELKYKKFIDSWPEGHPFYTHDILFKDAPCWNYSLINKPLSFWKAHTYAIEYDEMTNTITCLGGIKWGFQFNYFFSLWPTMILPEALNSSDWHIDQQCFTDYFSTIH